MGLLLKAFLGKLLEGAEEETEGGDLGTVLKLAKGITKGEAKEEAKGEAEVDKETKAIEPTTGRLDETIETEPSSFNEAFVNELVGKPTDLSKSGRLSYLGKSLADVLRSKIGAPSVEESSAEQRLENAIAEREFQKQFSNQQASAGLQDSTTDNLGTIQLPQPKMGEFGGGWRPKSFSISTGGVSRKYERQPTKEEQLAEASVITEGKINEKTRLKELENLQAAQKVAGGTHRYMQQFQRSWSELKKFDPNIDKEGFGGWMRRRKAEVAEKVDMLPETSALMIRIQPMANAMARDIEGGRVTDQDRKIYADAFASAIKNPSVTNTRLLSASIIDSIDKGAVKSIVPILKQLAMSDIDITNEAIDQVLDEFPELVDEIYGEIIPDNLTAKEQEEMRRINAELSGK